MSNEPEPRVRYGGSFELVSVRQGLIELEFGDRLRIRRIEFGGLIEREVSLGWAYICGLTVFGVYSVCGDS